MIARAERGTNLANNILKLAGRVLKRRPELSPIVAQVEEAPRSFQEYITVFNSSCINLNMALQSKRPVASEYQNIRALQEVRTVTYAPTLEAIADLQAVNWSARANTIHAINQAAQAAGIDTTETQEDANAVLSKLLVDVYAIFLARNSGSEKSAGTIKRAVEENLFRTARGTRLELASEEWILEEREHFSPQLIQEVQARVEARRRVRERQMQKKTAVMEETQEPQS